MKTAIIALISFAALTAALLLISAGAAKKSLGPRPGEDGRTGGVPGGQHAFLTAPEGFKIETPVTGLTDPRDMIFDSQNNLLVSETDAGRVVVLSARGAMPTGHVINTVLTGLNKPHGMGLFKNYLLVAQQNNVARYVWDAKNLTATFNKTVVNLPEGGNHFTRSLLVQNDGKVYVSIGSSCNSCREKDPRRASVMVTDVDGAEPKIFAHGLRNSVFMTLNPKSSQIWATEMGRDFLGDNLPPDEINILREGANYGWPGCYGNRIPDSGPATGSGSASCKNTLPPVFEVCAHCAPLGLTFINSPQFPKDWQGDLLAAYHGSWNRSTPSGYKVVRLKIAGDSVVSEEDFITGFLDGSNVLGRPAGLVFDNGGNLYISDDEAGAIYKVSRR